MKSGDRGSLRRRNEGGAAVSCIEGEPSSSHEATTAAMSAASTAASRRSIPLAGQRTPLNLSFFPAHQSISGHCWTKGDFRIGRFGPESGHRLSALECLLRANLRLMQRNKTVYWITSSARAPGI